MSWYYPEGVTGNELQLAGPNYEVEATWEVTCYDDECELMEEPQEVEGMEWGYDNVIHFDWKCPKCGHEYQNTRDYDPMDDHPDI